PAIPGAVDPGRGVSAVWAGWGSGIRGPEEKAGGEEAGALGRLRLGSTLANNGYQFANLHAFRLGASPPRLSTVRLKRTAQRSPGAAVQNRTEGFFRSCYLLLRTFTRRQR